MASPVDPSRNRAVDGFTLIEVIVVLSIIAVLAVVSFSAFAPAYNRSRAAWQRDDIERQLGELPQRVRQNGRGGILTSRSGDDLPDETIVGVEGAPVARGGTEAWQVLRLRLPAGWRLEVDRPIFYHFTGACEGGEVVLRARGTLLRYVLTAPLCRPVASDAPA
jgi:prepilin-type N-terminal cleavage/methylation domain-containing protein